MCRFGFPHSGQTNGKRLSYSSRRSLGWLLTFISNGNFINRNAVGTMAAFRAGIWTAPMFPPGDLSEWPINKKPFSSERRCRAQLVIDLGIFAQLTRIHQNRGLQVGFRKPCQSNFKQPSDCVKLRQKCRDKKNHRVAIHLHRMNDGNPKDIPKIGGI